jgi:DnaJ-domain-containing protein 1
MSSFLKDILSGVGSLVEKISADGSPLSGIDESALHDELAARIEMREKLGKVSPADDPRARWAGGSAASAQKRREAAQVREKRIRGDRQQKEQAARRTQEEAFRRMREEAARQAHARPPPGEPSSGGSSGRGASGGGSARAGRGFPGLRKDEEIARAYKTLDLAYGADRAAVKASYRKLMRKYHPDLHNQTPQKQKAATELSMQVTHAYNVLEKHLDEK